MPRMFVRRPVAPLDATCDLRIDGPVGRHVDLGPTASAQFLSSNLMRGYRTPLQFDERCTAVDSRRSEG